MKEEYVMHLAGSLMLVSDVAEMLGVTRQRVHHLLKSGRLDGIQKRSIWLITATSVQQYIDDRRREELDRRQAEDLERLEQDRRRFAEDSRYAQLRAA